MRHTGSFGAAGAPEDSGVDVTIVRPPETGDHRGRHMSENQVSDAEKVRNQWQT
jgi:hypothetical protein